MEDDALWWDDESYTRYQAWDGDEPLPKRPACRTLFEDLPMPDFGSLGEPPF